MPTTPPYQLDTTTGQRRFSQAAAGYDSASVLQDLVRTELLERLEVVQLQPTVVLDLGCGTGQGSAALLARYAPLQPLKERAKSLLGLAPKPPQARVIGIDSAPGMLAAAAAHVRANPLGELLAADACALPFPAAHAELVFASLLLPWIADPDALFAEVRRVLRPGGLFAFATLGPDTLHELRAASKVVDDTPRVLEFTDMPELARGLQQAGFADPVLDRDLHRLTYSGTAALFADLRALGATNRRKDRAAHLTGRARIEALSDAYEIHRDASGRLPVTCEVIYGHAWVPAGDAVRRKRSGNPNEVVVPLSSVRRRP